MSRLILILISGTVLILCSSCLFNSSDDTDDPGEPFITGIITDIEQSGQRILVEENPDITGPLENGGNKIWLTVDDDTSVYRNNDGELVNCNFACLQKNIVVSAWVTGAVAESYPLQGTASRIVITGEQTDN